MRSFEELEPKKIHYLGLGKVTKILKNSEKNHMNLNS